MAWSDTTNNLRQQIGQKTSNIANIGQSERESRRARNVALLNNLTQIGMGIGRMGFEGKQAELGRGHDITMEGMRAGNAAELQKMSDTAATARDADRYLGTVREREAGEAFKIDKEWPYELAKMREQIAGNLAVAREYSERGDKAEKLGPLGPQAVSAFASYLDAPGGVDIYDKAKEAYIKEGMNEENFKKFLEFANSFMPTGADPGEWLKALRGVWGAMYEADIGGADDEKRARGSGGMTFAPPGPAGLRTPEVMDIEKDRMKTVEQIKKLRDALKPQAESDPEIKAALDDIPMFLKLTNKDDLTQLLLRLQSLIGRQKQQLPPPRVDLGIPLSNMNRAPEPMQKIPKTYFPGM